MRILHLLLLLRLDSHIEVDLDLLVLEAMVERIARAGLRRRTLGMSGDDLSFEHDAQ